MHQLTAQEVEEIYLNYGIDPWSRTPFHSNSTACEKAAFAIPKDRGRCMAFCAAVNVAINGNPIFFGATDPGAFTYEPVQHLCNELFPRVGITAKPPAGLTLKLDDNEAGLVDSLVLVSVLSFWDAFVFIPEKNCLLRWTHDEYAEIFTSNATSMNAIVACFNSWGIEQLELT